MPENKSCSQGSCWGQEIRKETCQRRRTFLRLGVHKTFRRETYAREQELFLGLRVHKAFRRETYAREEEDESSQEVQERNI